MGEAICLKQISYYYLSEQGECLIRGFGSTSHQLTSSQTSEVPMEKNATPFDCAYSYWPLVWKLMVHPVLRKLDSLGLLVWAGHKFEASGLMIVALEAFDQ